MRIKFLINFPIVVFHSIAISNISAVYFNTICRFRYEDDDDDDSSEEHAHPKRLRFVDDDEE